MTQNKIPFDNRDYKIALDNIKKSTNRVGGILKEQKMTV